MKRIVRLILLLPLLAIAAAGCAEQQEHPKQTVATVLGGIGGAVAGAQFGKGTGQLVGVAIGTLAGAWIGGELGKSLDRADQVEIQKTTQKSLETSPSGQTTTWRNPDHNVESAVTPQAAFTDTSGDTCREYQQTITVGGKAETSYGTACRQADGSWRIMR